MVSLMRLGGTSGWCIDVRKPRRRSEGLTPSRLVIRLRGPWLEQRGQRTAGIDPMIPYTLVLKPGLVIYSAYNNPGSA
jgi:hypothetical protein